MKTYYYEPTMVKFEDPDNDGWLYGIAFHDEIICACCGGIFEIVDLNSDGLQIVDLDWVSFEDCIK